MCWCLCLGAGFPAYSFFADGLPFGQPLPLLQGLLLHLSRAELGLVLLEINLELLPVSQRRLLKWLTLEGDEHSQEDAIRNDRQQTSVNGACQPLPSRLKSQSGLKKEKEKKEKVNDWYTRFSSGLIVLHCWAIFLMMSTDFISRGRGCNMILT